MSEHISDTNPKQSKRTTLQNHTTASPARLPGRHTASTSLAHITPAERLGSLNPLILPWLHPPGPLSCPQHASNTLVAHESVCHNPHPVQIPCQSQPRPRDIQPERQRSRPTGRVGWTTSDGTGETRAFTGHRVWSSTSSGVSCPIRSWILLVWFKISAWTLRTSEASLAHDALLPLVVRVRAPPPAICLCTGESGLQQKAYGSHASPSMP